MPTVTYNGPEDPSPAIDLGHGSSLAFPAGRAIEITEEQAALIRSLQPAGLFIIDAPADPPSRARKR